MYILLLAILVISSLALIILVLMQSGKGSGLSGAFGSAGGGESSLFGANTATVIMKATAVFAAIFMLCCIAVAFYQRSMYKPLSFKTIKSEEEIEGKISGTKETPKENEQDKDKGTNVPAPTGADTGMTTGETKAVEPTGETKAVETTGEVKEEVKMETPEEKKEEPVKEEPAKEGGK